MKTALDAVAPEWDRFSVFRDESDITYERPPPADQVQEAAKAPQLPQCGR